MRLRCLAAVSAAAALMTFAGAARADLLIKVDKSDQEMTVVADGKPLYTWPVSTGRAGYNTPSGAYTPFRMDRHHFSREWDDAPMPYSIFFTEQGHAIHGTNEWRHLGSAASHGCVRLSVKHAAILWDLVKEHGKSHTTVVLTGKIPSGKHPMVAHAKRHHDEDVSGSLSSRRHQADTRAEQRAEQRRAERLQRAQERRLRAELQRRQWEAQQRADEQRYARDYARRQVYAQPRYQEQAYDRYDRSNGYYREAGPPPFPFVFLAPPPRGGY